MQAANVVQPAIVCLADQRVDGAHALVAGLCQRPADDGVDSDADAECIRKHDRRLDRAELLHLRRAGELAESVADKDRAWNLLAEEIAAVRKDGCHAGAHGTAIYERDLPDAHAGDVRDRVEGASDARAGLDAQITRAWTTLRGARGAGDAHQPDDCGEPSDINCGEPSDIPVGLRVLHVQK